jgi:3-deoxy-7-phosphoheptulonate synthase
MDKLTDHNIAHPILDALTYPCTVTLNSNLEILQQSLPIVTLQEILKFKEELTLVEAGQSSLLHIGECAEKFESCNEHYFYNFNQIINEIQKLYSKQNFIFLGRIAGQFFKPRSYTFLPDGKTLSFHGDGFHSEENKTLDPTRLLTAYKIASQARQKLISSINISHECLNLPFESSLLRTHENVLYSSSAHLLWIGSRTNQLDSPIVKFAAQIANPIGIKIAPNIDSDHLIGLIKYLNPDNESGKILIIPRFGTSKIQTHLPQLIHTVIKQKLNTTWIPDPLHGNTKILPNGIKVRYLEDITAELEKFKQIHKSFFNKLHGIHLEMTSEDILECINTGNEPSIKNTAVCDPRLNFSQVLNLLHHFFTN